MALSPVGRQPSPVFFQNVVLPDSDRPRRSEDAFEARNQPIAADQVVPQEVCVKRFAQWLRPIFVPPTARGKRLVLIGGISGSVGVSLSMGFFPAVVFFVGYMFLPLVVERFSERNL